jgi:hypothetical protein
MAQCKDGRPDGDGGHGGHAGVLQEETNSADSPGRMLLAERNVVPHARVCARDALDGSNAVPILVQPQRFDRSCS